MACLVPPRNASLHLLHFHQFKNINFRNKNVRCRAPRASNNKLNSSGQYTFGSPLPQERWTILRALLSENLNPLSIDVDKFIAARPLTRSSKLAGFGQLKQLEPGKMELSSLVVLPQHRGQGLGSALVEKLVQRAAKKNQKVFLITISKKKEFYARCGFIEVLENDMDAVPRVLQLEKLIGTPIARLAAGDSLVVLRHDT